MDVCVCICMPITDVNAQVVRYHVGVDVWTCLCVYVCL